MLKLNLFEFSQNREILQAMLAAVILIAEIVFEEDDRGAAQIADAVPFAHGKGSRYIG